MTARYSNTNDLVFAIAARARSLANEGMPMLRRIAESCDDVKHADRGQLIEWALIEDFEEEFPKEIAE